MSSSLKTSRGLTIQAASLCKMVHAAPACALMLPSCLPASTWACLTVRLALQVTVLLSLKPTPALSRILQLSTAAAQRNNGLHRSTAEQQHP